MGSGQARLYGPPARSAAGGRSPFHDAEGFVEHPLLRPRALHVRSYQLAMARSALGASTLVVMPAGLGKTVVAGLVAAERLRAAGGFVLVLAPTRAAARRLFDTFAGLLAGSAADRTRLVTASTKRADRDSAWSDGWVVVSTPETVEQELESAALSLHRCSLLVIDEAHRALGAYAYAQVARALRRDRPGGLTLALTAMAGADRRRVAALVDALALRHVEVRTRDDPEVTPHLRPGEAEVIGVDLTPEMEALRAILERELEPRAAELARLGALGGLPVRLVKRQELASAGEWLRRRHGRDGAAFSAGLQTHAQAVLLAHALELLETQGCGPLAEFLGRLGAGADASRAERSIAGNPAVRDAARLAGACSSQAHPKVDRLQALLRDLLRERPGGKSVVFVQSRDTVAALVERLGQPPPVGLGVSCAALGDKPTAATGSVHVLIGTVATGNSLALPTVDLVVFLDAPPSEIGAMQRRAHAGRPARIVVLVARDSRDDGALRAGESRGPNLELPLGERAVSNSGGSA